MLVITDFVTHMQVSSLLYNFISIQFSNQSVITTLVSHQKFVTKKIFGGTKFPTLIGSPTPQLLTGDRAVQFPIRSPPVPDPPFGSHLTSVRPQARSLRLPSPGSSLAPSSLPFEVNCEYLRSSCGSDTGICNPLIFNFYKFTVPPQLGRRGVQGMPYLFFDHDFNCLQLHNHFL